MELEAWKVDETQPETGDQTNKCIKIYRINPFHFSWSMEIAALKQSAFLHTCLFNEIVPICANSIVKAQWLLGIITSDYPWIGGLAREWLVGGQLSAETARNKASKEQTPIETEVCTVGRYCHAGAMFMTLLKVEIKDKVSRQVRQWRWGCQH